MNAKHIYIIRHGETDFNKKGYVQGSSIDSNLNGLGKLQANAFFSKYNHIAFDKIYTSKLKRTHQTVQPFVATGIPFDTHHGLNEISWGEKEGRELTEQDEINYIKLLSEWNNGNYDYKLEGAESPHEVVKRQKEAFEIILQQPDEKNILICTHGRAMKILISTLMDEPLSKMNQYEHSNLALYHIIYQNNRFRIVQANDIRHLNHITKKAHAY
ncbi:histidine phosphatase family protein [Flammeovirga kamogawensis]|uniref:Histidine phosphatase family protein n=1 Tax=Flammeovirga kamogawensis TaxID=373891 RepID=A0ABX8GUK5_9BACT|nr:histidine phosphatase family protein [Flammeovirga kamogawensis]MBB6459951.1 putative phosphoglycerate mutase [Flammeovirga kamogawensis]QWG06998.1 histidine phosphatase family protein [Flammeovirga kamogawensis]TRX68819.1 histidine phosphatase family protein [Flammeovirga kamogawensis]